MTIIGEAAAWACRLQTGDVPPRVEEKLRHQVLNILAAIAAGMKTRTGENLQAAVPGSEGRFWSFAKGRSYTLEESILLNCSLAMVLDYDDYLFMGHTGHSSVIVSLLLADREGKRLSECLPAVAAANEIAGRLGAATFFGPRNGQLWSYIHLAGAAAAAARILDLDENTAAHAAAIALYQPVAPLYPGFMGGESKVITAAGPTMTGIQSALLARAGLTGNLAVLEARRGFLEELAAVPLTFFLTGWGRAWVSDTLTFKPYPGCAYVDTTLDAWEEIAAQLVEERGEYISPQDVAGLAVEAGFLTMGMDNLSRAYRGTDPLHPININFSISSSLALAVVNRRITPACFDPVYLEQNREPILGLAEKITLTHDWKSTIANFKAMDETMDLLALFGNLSSAQIRQIRRQLKSNSQVPDLGVKKLLKEIRLGPALRWAGKYRRYRRGVERGLIPAFDLGDVQLEQLRLPFPARVTLRLKDGSTYSAYCPIPRGAPGGPSYLEEVRDKWMREAAPIIGNQKAARVSRMILEEDPAAGEILDLLQMKTEG